MNPSRSPFVLLAILALVGCDPSVNSTYRGEPMVTLHGEMHLATGLPAPAGVRLALVWNSLTTTTNDPTRTIQAINFEAQEVAYAGSFPLNYTFEVHFLPPAPPGQRILVSRGTLVAYEDFNGNGRLDLIRRGMVGPVDRVLASSDKNPSESFEVIYSSDGRPFSLGLITNAPKLETGFTLVRNNQRVDEDTSIPLLLDPVPELNEAVCEREIEGLRIPALGRASSYVFNPHAPYAHCFGNGPIVFAEAGVSAEGGFASVVTFNEGQPIDDARVTVNGRDLPFDLSHQANALSSVDPSWMTPGGMVNVRVQIPGRQDQLLSAKLPDAFAIVAPAPQTRFPFYGELTMGWSNAHADRYVYGTVHKTLAGDVEGGGPYYETQSLGASLTLYRVLIPLPDTTTDTEIPFDLVSIGVNVGGKAGESQLQGFVESQPVEVRAFGNPYPPPPAGTSATQRPE